MLQCLLVAPRGSGIGLFTLNRLAGAAISSAGLRHCSTSDEQRTLLPTIVIIGRPNVGKSTLFNRLTGKRAALVYDTPASHVTRDYKEGLGRLSDLQFRVVDTSGLEPSMTAESIQGRATRLTQQSFRRADAVLFVVDARSGLAAADRTAADWLRRTLKPVPPRAQAMVTEAGNQTSSSPIIVIANKCDHLGDSQLVSNALEAASLGFGNPVPYSAETQAGTADLYDALRPVVDAFHEHVQPNVQSAGLDVDGLPSHEGTTDASSTDAPHRETTAQKSSSRQSPLRPFGGWNPAGGSATPAAPEPPLIPHGSGATSPDTALDAAPARLNPESNPGTSVQQSSDIPGEGVSSAGSVPGHHGSGAAGEAPPEAGVLGEDMPIKVVLVGLPNAGKSTLLNRLLGYERALVGPEAALTRDAISEPLTWRGTRFEITDTAGWLQRATLKAYDESGGNVARMTVAQGSAKVNFGHAVVLVVDGAAAHERVHNTARGVGRPLSRRELALAGTVLEEGRLLLIALSKADMLPETARSAVTGALNAQIDSSFASWRDCFSVAWVSGATGHGLGRVLKRVTQLIPKWSLALGSKELNVWRHKVAVALKGNGSQAVTSVRFLKMTKTRPPTILAEFKGRIVEKSHLSALSRALRTSFGLHGVPVRVVPLSKRRTSQARRANS
eukprot:jgi/Ulvmu1/3979/UM182_0007.1